MTKRTGRTRKEAQLIPPDAYPQMVSKEGAARIMKILRAEITAAKAQAAMKAAAPPMRAAILQYVREMEQAAGDMTKLFEKAHEIRGFAETAGLGTTGRIAEILCRYMDDMERLGKELDASIVALHVSAITRAAHAGDDNMRVGDVVATELASLVARRLAQAQQP
jgi:chemotaxis protein histidine kinase CheA